ncbi:Fe-S cluster assembly protein SufD [Methylomonas sp. AM2-LC]|uniref:Fe-S cluster assembly protein SufD n=1 Tax=Methylomonas sp. AM2-LC TaxID=3153301 RepID=UPI0032674BAD
MMAGEHSAQHYLSVYPDYAATLPGQNNAFLSSYRQSAWQAFKTLGFPHQRLEEWRYTNLAGLSRANYLPVVSESVDLAWLETVRLADSWQIVLVNGCFAASLSNLSGLPPEVCVQSVRDVLQTQPHRVEALLGKAVSVDEHSLIAFNNAWFSDGVFVDVPMGVRLIKPIQIIHVSNADNSLAVSRQLVFVNENAAAELVETFVGSASSYFSHTVNECFLQPGAELTWYKVQTEGVGATHFGGTYVKQAAKSQFKHHNFALGSLLARSEIHTDLQDAAECELNGLFLGSQRQHLDNHTRINHLQPNAICREFYKGVLDQRARGVFQGRVIVAEQAQKTDSQMNNRNLLLSADAEVDTKPQLEIYADDVKCAHGVTVGQLDEKSVFFLQARGIDMETARHILTFAFANEMVDKVENAALRSQLVKQLQVHFPAISL